MKNNKKVIILLLIIGTLTAVTYLFYINGPSNNQNSLPITGNIEITDTELSFKVAGTVKKRLASEGETIQEGQVIALLDDMEFMQKVALHEAEVIAAQAALDELIAGSRPEEIAQAQAAVQRAKSRYDELREGSRPQEIAVAKAALQGAKADAQRLKNEFERQRELYRKEIISIQKYEIVQSAHKIGQARLLEAQEKLKLVQEGPRKEQIDQARAALSEARERLALVKKGPRSETIAQARARLTQAKEALNLAQTYLEYTKLISPLSGVVLSEVIESGEYIVPGTPVITVGNLEKVWLRGYIQETDLGRVKIGQNVLVTTDTYPDRIYRGLISFIASQAEFTPKNVQTKKERVKLVYRIKVDIPNPNLELKPGMPADAKILLEPVR